MSNTPPRSSTASQPNEMRRPTVSRLGVVVSLILLACFGTAALFVRYQFQQSPRVSIPIEQLPQAFEGWVGQPAAAMKRTSRDILKLDRYIRRTYSHPDLRGSVFLYIGYWSHQTGEHQAAKHTPSLCLPANGWKIERRGVAPFSVPLASGLGELLVNRIVGEYDHHQSLVYYWFVNGQDYYPEEWQSLARISWNALLGRRTDGGIIEMMVDIPSGPEGEKIARETLDHFLTSLAPHLDRLIQSPTN